MSGKVIGPANDPIAGARIAVGGAQVEFPVFSDGGGAFKVNAVPPSHRNTASAVVPGFRFRRGSTHSAVACRKTRFIAGLFVAVCRYNGRRVIPPCTAS